MRTKEDSNLRWGPLIIANRVIVPFFRDADYFLRSAELSIYLNLKVCIRIIRPSNIPSRRNLVILQFPSFGGGTYARFIQKYTSPVGVILLEFRNWDHRRELCLTRAILLYDGTR